MQLSSFFTLLVSAITFFGVYGVLLLAVREQFTTELMRNVHFSKRYQGYRYLRRCIMLAAEDEERLMVLVKGIYWQVAEEYHQLPCVVERNIRTVRDRVWAKGGKEALEQLTGMSYPWAPSVGELIEIFLEQVKADEE